MYKRYFKRVLDTGISGILLILLFPLFLLIILAIRIDTKGNGIFIQNRVGMNLKNIKVYKFRTMVENAELIGGYATKANDERITRIGKILRKTSLDELPQLINIFLGDMSFIGPRPDVEKYLNLFTKEHIKLRSSVRPGITGLAQINGRSNISLEDRIIMDEKYVRDLSLFLDLKILFKTFYKVVLRKGVN